MYELGEEVFTLDLPNLYQIWSESEVRPLVYGIVAVTYRWDHHASSDADKPALACMRYPMIEPPSRTRREYPTNTKSINLSKVIDLFGSDAENCFVAEVEGKVAGFCLGTTIEKKHSSCTYS